MDKTYWNRLNTRQLHVSKGLNTLDEAVELLLCLVMRTDNDKTCGDNELVRSRTKSAVTIDIYAGVTTTTLCSVNKRVTSSNNDSQT